MGCRKSRAIQARYFLLPRLCLDCVFSSAREIELAAGGATFFGFFSSRLLRFWPFAMSLPPSNPDKGSINRKRDNYTNLSRLDWESRNSFALAAGTSAVG
jgi:hypothetical protein